MRESIYTIPIHEVFEPKCGCPICSMRDMLEQRCIEYIMGAAMMEPDIRIETNRYGFCLEHLKMMTTKSNKLSIALMLETHLNELETKHLQTKSVINNIKSKKDIPSPAHTCFVCNEIDNALEKLISTVFNQYTTDSEFRNLFNSQEFFCFPHYDLLCKLAPKNLNKKIINQFIDDITKITKSYLVNLKNDVHGFSLMFDYRNSSNEKDENVINSIDRSVKFLTSR